MSERRCPICGKPVESKPQNPYDPFCSERCRMVDLGKWFSDSYRVPARPDELDDEQVDQLADELAKQSDDDEP